MEPHMVRHNNKLLYIYEYKKLIENILILFTQKILQYVLDNIRTTQKYDI